MNKLLQNNCIMNVLYDDHTKSTGRIDFYGGEVYYGEIQKDLPNGQGSLQMTDLSTYQGDFSKKGLINGEYTHFTKNKFIGSFSNDRLKSGRIEFRDGDVFQGVWSISRGKWALVKGTLFDEENNEVDSFSKENALIQIRSKLKVLLKNDKERGFCIKYDYFVDFDSTTYQKMIISGHGFSLTREEKGETYSVEKERSFALIPFEKTDIFSQNKHETIYKLPFGFNFSIFEGNEIGSLKFDQIDQIYAEGIFDFNQKKIFFSGKLKKGQEVLASLEIKKTIFTKLSIKLDNTTLRDLRSFYINLVEFTDHKKYLPTKSSINRVSQSVNNQAMKNMKNRPSMRTTRHFHAREQPPKVWRKKEQQGFATGN